MGQLTLILGGARSGKSTYAEELAAERGQKIVYIATAEALDAEMEARIQAHQKNRPESWQTFEIPLRVGESIALQPLHGDLVLLDCLTLLVTNVLLQVSGSDDEPDLDAVSQAIKHETKALLKTIQESDLDWIVVSNEVGMGLVPPYPLGRLYRDWLGWANRKLAAAAQEVFLMVAGLPIALHRVSDRPGP